MKKKGMNVMFLCLVFFPSICMSHSKALAAGSQVQSLGLFGGTPGPSKMQKELKGTCTQ